MVSTLEQKGISETISVDDLRELLEKGDPVTLLDVRPVEEWDDWRIPGSMNIDAYAALQDNDPQALAGVDLPAERPVVTVCGAGVTSLTAARQLQERGYRAQSLAGGMKAWSLAWNSADVPLETEKTQVIQLRRTGKGCLSYLVGSRDEALVVDASLPSEVYMTLAQERGWHITKVIDTHIHADHLSRGRPLAGMTGATLYLPQNRRASDYAPLRDGETLQVGAATLQVLGTPGHTPESASYLLQEQALFTGDTLFLEGVGRPDLEAGADEAQERARTLYGSLQRLQELAGNVLVLPGHTSEPVAFDGAPIAATMKQIREQVARLHLTESAFVEWILANLPAPPPNHSRIVALNESGEWPDGDVTELEAGANRCAVR